MFERLQRVDGSGRSGRCRRQFGDRHGLLLWSRALDVTAAGAGQVRMRGHRGGRERRLWGLRRDRWFRRGHDRPGGHLRVRRHLGRARRHLRGQLREGRPILGTASVLLLGLLLAGDVR